MPSEIKAAMGISALVSPPHTHTHTHTHTHSHTPWKRLRAACWPGNVSHTAHGSLPAPTRRHGRAQQRVGGGAGGRGAAGAAGVHYSLFDNINNTDFLSLLPVNHSQAIIDRSFLHFLMQPTVR